MGPIYCRVLIIEEKASEAQEGDVSTGDVGVMYFEVGGWAHELRHVGDLYKLKKTRKAFVKSKKETALSAP